MKKNRLIPLGLALMATNLAFAADEIHYTFSGQNSVTFDWRGTNAENSIGIGLSPGSYTQVVQAKSPKPTPTSSVGPFWEAKLTGLKANALYYYSIGNGPERTFRTAPIVGSSNFTVYVQGDIGDTSHTFNTGVVQDLVANGQPSFVLGLGGLTMGSINGKAAIDQHFNDVMVWSKEAAYMPAWGSQEWRTTKEDNFKNYKGRFNLPNSQTSPGTPLVGGEDWYWFDYGNVRFIALPGSWDGALANWKSKADTLMKQAQSEPKIQYIVTFGNQPAYSSGHAKGSLALKDILDSLGKLNSKYVLNVNSNSRNYERSHPQSGVVHITAGTGGADLLQDGDCLWLTCSKPDWSAFRTMHHGALKLNFTASNIAGSFICGPSGGGKNDVDCKQGSVVDSFTINAPTETVAKTTNIVQEKAKKKKKKKNRKKKRSGIQALAGTACTQTALNVSGAANDGGFAYLVRKTFGTPADNSNFPSRSILRLFENGVEIGPAHSIHADIRNIGKGRFSHKSLTDGTVETLRFSASNNTNPKTNGKSYGYCVGSTTTTSPAPAPTPTPTPTPVPATSSCAPVPTSSLVVNVKDKGATGNGSTNDTAAIQAAINQVAGTGGTVLVPDGTYIVDAYSNRLQLKSNMTLRMTSGAVLKAIPNNMANYGVIRVWNVSNVNIIGGKLQGERFQHQGTTGEWGHGIEIYGSSSIVIEGVTSRDMWGDGFYIDNNSSNVTACSIVADNNRRQGMSIVSANGVVVKNSIFKNTNGVAPMDGLLIEPDADKTVSNVQILNSQALYNKNKGIEIWGGASNAFVKNVTIDGNTVANNGVVGKSGAGIMISRTTGHRVTNNIVKSNLQNGISFNAGASSNTVTGNTVTYSGNPSDPYSGIGIDMYDRSTNNTITGNTVTDNRRYNIYDSVGGNIISGNNAP